MEFKGTKEKWTRYTSSVPSIENPTKHSVYIGTKRIALCYDLFDSDTTNNVDYKEAPYNAQLISKAPEMLEMLLKLHLIFEGRIMPTEQHMKTYSLEIKELIKEATEVK